MTTTFTDADIRLHHARTGAPLPQKKVGNNTVLIRRDEDTIAVRLHSTDVVTFHRDGTLTLDTGGWYSVTTKARMNEYCGQFAIGSERGTWYVHCRNPNYTYENGEPWALWTVRYYDGIRLDPTTMAEPEPSSDADALDRADDITYALVKDYLKGLTKDVWDEIIRDASENGVAGDGTNLGDRFGDVEHLRNHISKDERYYMASLGLNAVREAGYRRPEVVVGHLDIVKRALRRYLLARLLVGNRGGRRPTAALAGRW